MVRTRPFASSLSYDLYSYAYSLLSMGLEGFVKAEE